MTPSHTTSNSEQEDNAAMNAKLGRYVSNGYVWERVEVEWIGGPIYPTGIIRRAWPLETLLYHWFKAEPTP